MNRIVNFVLRHGVGGGYAASIIPLFLAIIFHIKGDGAYAIMAASEVIAAAYYGVNWFAPKNWRATVDQGVEQSLVWFCAMLAAKAAKNAYVRVRSFHHRAFDPVIISQAGAVGRDLSCARPRAAGRQSGASVARRQASGSKSGDDSDGDDGEPPHRFYTFASAAKILDCSPKTLRNKVSAGLIPPPLQTIVGPRFSAQQIADLLFPPPIESIPPTLAPKRRGRPRIAAQRGMGGAA